MIGIQIPSGVKNVLRAGFTLIELSIVLVIIGLIVGGVLVGRDLINAAAVRAQISQIEKFRTAANTFKGKYGYLPGDIPDPYATQFNFVNPRGAFPGGGDGNGVIEGASCGDPLAACNSGLQPLNGEQAIFWVDLSTAHLIDGSFSLATPTTFPTNIPQSQVGQYLPQAKINSGGSVYVWSGGWKELGGGGDNNNYFGLSTVNNTYYVTPFETALLTVAQAYSVDKKVDDGLPQSGGVMAMYIYSYWAAGGNNRGDYSFQSGGRGPVTQVSDIGVNGVLQGPYSCYDARSTSGGSGTLPEQYSIEVNNGAGVNCVLSFKFQ